MCLGHVWSSSTLMLDSRKAPALEEDEAVTLHNGSEELCADQELIIPDCDTGCCTEMVLWPLKQRHVSNRHPQAHARLFMQ